MIPAGELWDRRFAEHPWPTDPDPLLVELASPLEPGRGIDLGSGPGRNGLWLASRGWQMTLLDASRVALGQAEARASQAGFHIDTVHGDVIGWEPERASYDLVILANLHPGAQALAEVLGAAAHGLVPGGHLYVVGHDLESLGSHGPADPDRLLSIERLSSALPATLVPHRLERRSRSADHDQAADERPDVIVFAWATKTSP